MGKVKGYYFEHRYRYFAVIDISSYSNSSSENEYPRLSTRCNDCAYTDADSL